MPRGPGKKENYNLDYARFNALDQLDDGDSSSLSYRDGKADADADAAAGAPSMQDMLRTMPKELQGAFHLMQMARASGDKTAEKHACELALKAVEDGGPEVKKSFLEEMGRTMPEMAERLAQGDPQLALKEALQEASGQTPAKKPGIEELGKQIGLMQKDLEKGRDTTKKQMESLAEQQSMMEKMQSPEDFFKFMHEGGMSEADLQRCFAGDTTHMEACMQKMLDKTTKGEDDEKAGESPAELALKATDTLHSTLFPEKAKQEIVVAATASDAKPAAAKKVSPPKPEVKIPEHRLQYQKDENGRFLAVELRCTMPGVKDMGVIDLDVSEQHLRLSTRSPAPLYAVNAGPFPVPIDAGAARAKYSKKRQELHVTVPMLLSS